MTSTYALGVNVGNPGRGDWGADLLEAFKTVGKVRPLGRQFPWLINTAMIYFNPGVIAIFSPQTVNLACNLIFPLEIMRASAEEHARQAEGNLPESETTPERLNAESSSVLRGVETTARTMTIIMFYIRNDPAVLTKLQDELKIIIPDPEAPFTLARFEALPCFSGVVSDGYALAHGITGRMPRIAPGEDLRYKQLLVSKEMS
ncbi:Trichodiene oxygenase [Diaporthe amygdali]|uniref:Trichodiene oxygenase n=1 Tax=Phomopsis amygdali TaxID=1214568 RepID=UPI0022FE95A4|nr:Trichodiene oxygenase [Diaporthe amygdali]KAJ0124040.1 Trichodiene oxygenase [Diaporthe amygdali]